MLFHHLPFKLLYKVVNFFTVHFSILKIRYLLPGPFINNELGLWFQFLKLFDDLSLQVGDESLHLVSHLVLVVGDLPLIADTALQGI